MAYLWKQIIDSTHHGGGASQGGSGIVESLELSLVAPGSQVVEHCGLVVADRLQKLGDEHCCVRFELRGTRLAQLDYQDQTERTE